MAEGPAAELEVSIADAGLLLVELEKFRAARTGPLERWRAEAIALGDHARRLHRARTLDDASAAPLLAGARTLVERLHGALRQQRAAAAYRAAVDAHRVGDHAALARLLPALLDGLEPVASPPALFHAVPWLRRNRPRPAAEIAADIVRLAREGLAAERDALVRGLDPELPAVPLVGEPGGAEPVLLRFAGEALPPAVFRLADTGEHLVHVAVLRAPFTVLVPDALDDEELGEITVDYARYRAELLGALDRVGVPVVGA